MIGHGLLLILLNVKSMYDTTENGIIILNQENMPMLARQIARLILDEMSRASLLPSDERSAPDSLISKAKACEILDRCDSTLSKWAKRGILTPVRRGGSLYYRLDDVMKIYNGE